MSVVIYEKKGRTAYITLNRPKVLNAINTAVKRELGKIWIDFRDDPEVWVGIVSGAGGKAFSTGADVREQTERKSSGQPLLSLEPRPLEHGLIQIWKPLIAAISGWCIGGGLELALVCDIRIATEHSQFGLVEPKVGHIARGGGIIRLSNQIPFAVAMEMLLTASTIDAQRAYEVGLVNQVVPSPEELMPAAERMVEKILACSPLSVRVTKEQALKGFNVPSAVGLSLRCIGTEEMMSSHDIKEGPRAFIEKRKPVWKGK